MTTVTHMDNLASRLSKLKLAGPSVDSELTKEVVYCNHEGGDVGKSFRIIHFNDVYDIEGNPKEASGGAARFATAVKQLNEEAPCLVLFSGDAFSPSSRKLVFFFDSNWHQIKYFSNSKF